MNMKNSIKKSAYTLAEVVISISITTIILLATFKILDNILEYNKMTIKRTNDLNSCSLAITNIISFLELNDGLYTKDDITDTGIISSQGLKYIKYNFSNKCLYINENGNSLESNTPILLDSVNFKIYTSDYGKTILRINVIVGDTNLITSYPITLR